jgi:hypothetical protein
MLATPSTNTSSPPTVKTQADASSDELAELVNDPDISHLMRQLNSRFG